jgi:hypothetical protein
VAHLKLTKIALAFASVLTLAVSQDKPPDKKPKNQAEYDLITGIAKDADPANRLKSLQKWATDFPDSDYADERQQSFLVTYEQMKDNRNAVDKAKEILGKHPNDFLSLQAVMLFGLTLNNNNPAPADLDLVQKTCEYVVDNGDKIFATDNKPSITAATDWPKMRPYYEPLARHTIAQVYLARKNDALAEEGLTKMTQKWPNDAVLDQMLARVLVAESKAKPEKYPTAMFYYARAAAYDGEGALPAADKQQSLTYVTRAYKAYHGSDEGLNTVLATAKANPAPPADFKITSTADIAQAKADAEEAAARANPVMAMWKTIKTGLTGDGADAFWASVNDAGLPGKNPSTGEEMKFKGKLVSMKPLIRPKTLIIAVEAPEGDVTLNFEMPLAGKMDPGAELEFTGTAKAYTKSPYMLTLEVEKENLVGWKPVTPPRAPVQKKKAQ